MPSYGAARYRPGRMNRGPEDGLGARGDGLGAGLGVSWGGLGLAVVDVGMAGGVA